MKRLIALITAFLLVFSLCGCNKKTENSDIEGRGAEIKAAVENGSIPEIPFALGSKIEDVKGYYDQLIEKIEEEHGDSQGHVHGDDDIYYNEYEGNLSVEVTTGKMSYFYEKSKKDKGISVITTTETAFGFQAAVTSKNEIEKALTGLEGTTLLATEDELYFVPFAQESMVLRYKIGNYQLDFHFNENLLTTTVLMNTENWTVRTSG